MLSLALSPSYAAHGVLLAGTESCCLFGSHDRGRTWARLGEDVVLDAVNGIVLAPECAPEADALVMLGEAVQCESDIARGKRKTANLVEDRERAVA